MALKPQQPVPALDLPLVIDTRFDLAEQRPRAFTMLVFYRGLHCPVCKGYLQELNEKIGQFRDLGVTAVAVSTDTEDNAKTAWKVWNLGDLPIAYGLPIAQARDWGLYISKGIKEDEPERFSEPGLFLVKPDGMLYAASVNSMPFSRPHFDDVATAIGFVTDKGYPARGEA
ncbi:peroxiredoxin-like family protein [Caenispirillum salinarum]|uniref:peroxiredoxin-like family protein n=1 Tax=Caenispirillum salinarum TaxID=859058 RepID=UPI00384B7A01